MTKEIQLTQGKKTLVDDAWFEYLSKWKWYATFDGNNWYAIRKGVLRETVYMHRVISGAPKNKKVDHKDGDGLNNTCGNLRVCTQTQNNRNKRVQKNSTTGYKGVYPSNGRFSARIKTNEKSLYIGAFDTPEEAAAAYNEKAKELFGPFAWLNPLPSR